ncbi:Rne/Rng family ribonuclease [Agrococcus citreus]
MVDNDTTLPTENTAVEAQDDAQTESQTGDARVDGGGAEAPSKPKRKRATTRKAVADAPTGDGAEPPVDAVQAETADSAATEPQGTDARGADAQPADADAAEAQHADEQRAGAEEPGHEPGLTDPGKTDAVGDDAAAGSHASDGAPSDDPRAAALALPELPAGPFGLLFHAPDLAALPALPALRDDEGDDDDDDDQPGNRRGRRSRSRTTRSSSRETEDEKPLITEPQKVRGSTRLEAKRQRRREGRDAGRRRTVVTETEFLARRESVDRQMIVRSKHDRVQLAVLEDGVLVEHYVAKASESSLIGNVYLGRVQNVLPSMEAAFVDIGRGRNAVLYSGEVDWDAAELEGQPRKIELALKPGDTVLVQVTKDPVGHKGARLTSQISLPGRYLVSVPGGSMNGISRKLPDTERARLKKILKQVLPEGVGVIVRTAAEGATEDQLTRDVERLTRQWERIQQQVKTGTAPQRLHAEPDLLVKIVRDVFNEDFHKLVIQGSEALTTIREYLEAIAPDLLDRVEAYEGTDDPFSHFRISEQIDKALDRKVWLPSGGSLVIDRTEAMTVVDVNTGRFVGAGGNLEETVTKNNIEAAEEVVRQLRLRDIGGIIVIDFIDMVLESNRDLVQRRLIECLSRDRTKHQVAEVTSLGLVQMTRKKLGLGLLEAYSESCEVCAGRGVIVHHEPISRPQRQQQAENGGGNGRSRRGGRGKQSDGQQPEQHQQQQPTGGTHAITEDLRKGLSQIAAAGKGKPEGEQQSGGQAGGQPSAEPDTQQLGERGTQESGQESREQRDGQRGDRGGQQRERDGRSRRERGGQPSSEPSEQPSGIVTPSKAAVEAVAAEPIVTILDIPVEPVLEPSAPKASRDDLDGLLGSALDALATPAPGTGKAARRSRRASSGVITAKPDEQR